MLSSIHRSRWSLTRPPRLPRQLNRLRTPFHIDSDGDGLTNAWDEYPFDDGVKRKEPVGIRHYGLVPLTSYSRGEMIGQFNGGNLEIPSTIGCIALDDEHRVSWWTREQKTRDADALTYNIHHWWTWDNNAISDKRQKLDTLPAIGGGAKSEAWAPSDISPRGMLVGTWSEAEFSDVKSSGFYSGRMGEAKIQPQNGDVSYLNSHIDRISWANSTFELYGGGTSASSPDVDRVPVRYNRSQWNGVGMFAFHAINSQGSALGLHTRYAPLEDPPPQPIPAVWAAGGIFTIHDADWLFGFNASGTIVGRHLLSQDSQSPFFDQEELGAIWKLGTSAQESFLHHWIPPVLLQSYTGRQLKLSLPLLINDNNEIIFAALNRESSGGGFYEGRYLWIHESAKTSAKSTDVQALVFGNEEAEDIQILGQNQVGSLAVQHRLGITPLLAIPCDFVTDPDNLRKGFDYPIFDDPPNTADFKDHKKPKWWTSLTYTDMLNEGLNISSHVTLRFANQDAARLFKVRIKPSSVGLITLEQGAGNVQGTDTPLVIKAVPPTITNPTRKVAQIEVCTPLDHAIRTLNVRVLPEVMVPVQIIYLYDSVDGGDDINNPTFVTHDARNAAEIVGRMNYAFKQCGVRFIPTVPRSQGFNYDNGGNGRDNNNKFDDSEIPLLTDQHSGFDPGTLTVFVVKQFSADRRLGLSLADNPPPLINRPWVLVSADAHIFDPTAGLDKDMYYKTIAHEVGHVFSLRGHSFSSIPSVPDNVGPNNHDLGKRPLRYGKAYQLMHPSGGERPQDYWIRNEDWVLANEAAAFLQ